MKSFEDFLKEHPNLRTNNLQSSSLKENNLQTNNLQSNSLKENNLKSNNLQNNNPQISNLKTASSNLEELEEFDKIKTKVLKYVVYKKRTEAEIRQKFSSSVDGNLLEDVIENLKENNYINDENYIERAVSEFMAVSTLSRKEIRNKLYAKGLNRDIISSYFEVHQEELEEYEIMCAKKNVLKKKHQMEEEKIEQFLFKKGYTSDVIKIALEEISK